MRGYKCNKLITIPSYVCEARKAYIEDCYSNGYIEFDEWCELPMIDEGYDEVMIEEESLNDSNDLPLPPVTPTGT